jgi:hypothetical protein
MRAARLAALVAALVLGLVTAASAAAASFVALGDSYAAGPLIPVQQPNPYGCLRSDHNYAHLAAARLGVALRDISCSGAETGDMTSPQNVDPDGPNPPQFDALDPGVQTVTLNISGNDIGFSEIIKNCATVNPFTHPCLDRYDPNGVDELAARIAAVAPKVGDVLDGIHARAPGAKVLLLNYAAILPETGYGCYPQMPLGYKDVPYLRATEKRLNAMLADEAAAHGATLVDWYTASIGHDTCKTALTRWVEPIVPTLPAAPVHPNARGMAGAAPLVVAAAG